MKRLKIILLFSIILLTIIYRYIYININHGSKYSLDDKEFIGVVDKINIKENKMTIIIKGKEKLLVNSYNNTENIALGYKIKVVGKIVEPSNNTSFNLFNYRNYLLSQKIYNTITADKIEIIDNNINIFYKIKNKIIDRINGNKYLDIFILGNNEYLDSKIKESYRINGISHLFSVSGMHVSFLSIVLLFIFNKISKKYSKTLLAFSLLFYAFLVDFSPSIMRSILFLILIMVRKKSKLNIEVFSLFIILTCAFIIYNPYIIYNSGFIYSFTISGFLIFFRKTLQAKNYFLSIFKVSLLSFLASFPITIYNNFEINFISPFLNVIFVPLITFILFPFSFITFIFPSLNNIYSFFMTLLEKMSMFFSNISIFKIVLSKPNLILILLYYISIKLVIINKKNMFILILLIIIHTNINTFSSYINITFMDVNQGDSILISFPNNKGNILIDTGGNAYANNYFSNSVIIPYLKSLGIKKIDYFILSHGDYDHMGEAINLVENFKVDKVIFNCGEFNDLESELIKVLDKRKIPYYSCIKELNIDKNKLYFLQTKEYDNENDNSNVMYIEIDGYKFMFMGDAGVEKEKDILDKYNILDIDVLKVGHHGSKTGSSKEFINEINPKYSIISVGKNNRYGHPNKEVLKVLEQSKIYRTDEDGSIMFKIKNNKLKIETCEP